MTQPDNDPMLSTRTQNQGIARLTILRQRGGSRLFGAFDSGGPTPPPLPPPMFITESQGGYNLRWATPDDGGSPLTRYRVYRGSPRGKEHLIAEVKPGRNTHFDKRTFMNNSGVYYKVAAVNALGEGSRSVKFFPSSAGSE